MNMFSPQSAHSGRRTLFAGLVALTSLCALSSPLAHAQAYPSKPIHLVVPYGPGGNTDILARVAAQKLGEVIGQPVIIDNKPGAYTLVGIRVAHAAAPDGYTLLMGNNGTAILPFISSTPAGYNFSDWKAIGSMGTVPMVLSVPPSMPVKSMADLIAYDKAHPGSLNLGQVGGHTQLLAERLKYVTGLKVVDINFGSAAQALTNVAGGQIQMFIDGAPTSIALHKADKIRIIAVASEKRLAQLPDVPTFKEQGFPAMTTSAWYSVFVQAKAPPAVIERLSAAMAKVITDPAVKERMVGAGGEPWTGSLSDFDAFITQDARALGEDGKRSGYKLPQ